MLEAPFFFLVCQFLGMDDHREDRRATCTVSVEEGTVPSVLLLDFFIGFERSVFDFGEPRASSILLRNPR